MKPPSEQDSLSLSLSVDDQIREDLEACVNARALIPVEQEKVRALIDVETSHVKRDYLWWQHDLIDVYIRRAAKVAEKRLTYLGSVRDPEEENERCKADVIHWLRYWAWTLDPRMESLKTIPLYPFRFQEECVRFLLSLFERQEAGVLDKSREQGASWLLILLVVHHWLFKPYFQALFGSKKEDAVDSVKEPDSLLEKARFQLRRTPAWMLPEGFSMREHGGYMKIINPETEALISGEAPTPNFGASGRYSVIVFDEHALWPHGGYPQWTSASQAARVKISATTPRGKFTKQAELRFSGKIPVHSLHWSKHPWKDERWYNGQSLEMTPEEIAQELDINYEASQPGRIFPETIFNEVYSVITWSEFARVYKQNRIPKTWNLGRCQDVGTTDEHVNITTWSAKPRKDDPVPDTVCFFREFMPPLDWTVQEIAEGKRDERGNLLEDGLMQLETPLGESSRMVISLISHEGKSEQRTYQYTCKRYPTRFSLIQKPQVNAGLSEMRALMKPIPDETNPFVLDPRTLDSRSPMYVREHECDVCKSTHDGEHIMGRSRFVIVVADNEGELQWDGERLYRTPAETSAGMVRLRSEIPLYHYPVTEKNKPVAQRKPFARFNDAIDTARYQCRVWGPPNAKPSAEEEFENQLPDSLRMENIPRPTAERRLTPKEQEEAADLIIAREVMISEKGLKKKTKKAVHFRKRRYQR